MRAFSFCFSKSSDFSFVVVSLQGVFFCFFFTKTEQLMCSKSFKFVEQRGHPGLLEFSTLNT